MNQSQDNLKTQGTLDGIWDYNSFDSDEISKEIFDDRFRSAELASINPLDEIEERKDNNGQIDEDYVAQNLKQYNFYFYTSLKCPLAYQEIPMPSGCSYIFRFARAKAKLSLMKLGWELFKEIDSRFSKDQYDIIPTIADAYSDNAIPLQNPELHIAFTNDSDMVKRTQTVSEYGLKIPFLDFSMRRNILVKGIIFRRILTHSN